MRSFKEIKAHYHFTEEDEARLVSLKDLMTDNTETVMEAFHSWLFENRETATFYSDEERKNRIFSLQRQWFLDLFAGSYKLGYYERLIRIGQKHVKSSVEAHFMNRAMNIIRNACIGIIEHSIDNTEERIKHIISVEKLLDINLDIITSSYIEEELRTYSPAYRVSSALITFSERFAKTMNLVLVLSLIGLTLGVIVLFVSDVYNFLRGDMGTGIITALGSLLVLWVMIELMNTEIDHLKGGKVRISVFIGVALVAFIRETLIATLKKEDITSIQYLIALILILGIVYWLINKTEEKIK
jgi:uncharacterized membrane protein (DUF373 family)